MGQVIKPGAKPDGQVMFPASCIVGRGIAHTNLLATAETSGVLRRPLSYSNAAVQPVEVLNGTRFYMRARYPIATTTATTDPVVRVYGVVGPDPTGDGVWADNETVAFVDLTGDITVFADPANDLRDTNFYYTAPAEPGGGELYWDCRGFRWLLPLTVTAGVLTDGTDPTGCELEIFVLN